MASDNSKGKRLAGALALVAATFAVYFPAMRGGFIWDDNALVTANPLIRHANGLLEIWVGGKSLDYTPVTLSAFWLEWRLWGMAATGYHVVNIALFSGAVVLLWRILRKLSLPGAWLAALLYAIHPVNTASVAWIAEQKNALALVFYLLAILWFLDFRKSRQTWRYVLVLLATALAMLSKGSTVILPAVFLICVGWNERRIRRADLLETAPFFALAAAMGLVTIHFQQRLVAGEHVSMAFRLARAGDAVWFYLWKDSWPVALCAIYPEWEIQPDHIASYLPLLAIAALFFLLALGRRKIGRGPLFAWTYFIIALAPVLGLIEMSYMDRAYVADWWQQLALIGVVAIAGAGIAHAWSLGNQYRRLAIAAGTIAVTWSLAVVTWYETTGYRTLEIYCRRTLALNPGAWNAWNNLGAALDAEGRIGEALLAYQKSLQVKPANAETLYNLGNVMQEKGEMDAAEQNYRQALETNPRFTAALVNLGILLSRRGDLDGALAGFQKAQQLSPDDPQVYVDLGNVLRQEGRGDEAMRQYQRALQLNPSNERLRAAVETLSRRQ
jgi:Flp pilus assembly protein TadD